MTSAIAPRAAPRQLRLYVLDAPDRPGGEATVRLRVPREHSAGAVALRYVHDGEPRGVQAEVDGETATETWWRATFPVCSPDTRYRWLVTGGDLGYAWVNGAGVVPADVPDADDFVLSLDRGGPEWHLSSVVYEIFPDRFASSGLGVEPPPWAVPRAWDELPTGRGPATPCEWFGGDLRGVEQRLDHVERLGANAIYLTPVFPAGSTHRYDASAFDTVDPLLGGDEALRLLARRRAARHPPRRRPDHEPLRRGPPWFRAALADAAAPERAFFSLRRRRCRRATRAGTGAVAAEAGLAVARAARADDGDRPPPARRLDGLAHRRRQHDRPLPRRRPEPRRRPAASGRPAAAPSSPSTATTTGTTSARAAGTAR